MVALAIVIISVTTATNAAPLNNSTEPVPEVHVLTEQANQTDRTAQVEEAQKPVETERAITWKDNPSGCDLNTQYVLADTFECKDKPKPTVAKATHPVGCENYRELVSQYAWNVDVALQVIRAESGCNPSAVGDNRVIGGIYAPSCGLFQIRTLSSRPDCDSLKDPSTNVAWAYKLYASSKWQPWSVCKNGKVSCY